MENEIQSNPPPIQPTPQIPVSPSTNLLKILLLTASELIIIAGSVFIGVQIGKNQIAKISPIAETLTPTPATKANLTQKCSTDKECPNNTFCDYSQYSSMGPNGQVSSEAYGSQQCILKCQNDNQCPNGQCQTFEMVSGDLVTNQKGCVNQNDQTLGIQINTCCSCPTKVRKSLIGTDGWVIYEKDRDYSGLRPTDYCKKAICAPCPPLE